MSIKDQQFEPSVYSAPPENLEAALERGQAMGDPAENKDIFRRAQETVPEDLIEAQKRMRAAGIHPTNLIGMVWKNVQQLQAVLTELGWKAEFFCHKRTMDAGRFRQLFAIATAGQRNKLIIWLWEKPYMLVITCAVLLDTSDKSKKIAAEHQEMIEKYSGPLDQL